MLKSFSNKAIATKARAMYGARVTAADCEELVKKRSVGEVAAYLRDNTHYREVLSQVEPSAIHRGQLENFLRSLSYIQYQRLIAFDFGQQKYYRYRYLRDEIQQIVDLLRYLSGKEQGQASGQYNFRYDQHLAGQTTYDLEEMVKVTSYWELVDFFGDTPYGRLLRRFPPDPSGQIDMMGCEQALSTYYYKQMLTLIDREFSGGARKALREMTYQRIDWENLIQVYRLKRFFHSDGEFIRKSILPFTTPSQKVIDQLIGAQGVPELHTILRHSGFLPEDAKEEDGFIENRVLTLREKQSRRDMRNSPYPAVVLHAYMTHLEIELEDLINIIESVRYGLPPEEIRRMLILS